jgi:hypothetical protein
MNHTLTTTTNTQAAHSSARANTHLDCRKPSNTNSNERKHKYKYDRKIFDAKHETRTQRQLVLQTPAQTRSQNDSNTIAKHVQTTTTSPPPLHLHHSTSTTSPPPPQSWTPRSNLNNDNGMCIFRYFTSSAGKIFHDGMDDPPSWTYPSNQTSWHRCGEGDIIGLNGNFCMVTKDSKTPFTDEDLALTEVCDSVKLTRVHVG